MGVPLIHQGVVMIKKYALIISILCFVVSFIFLVPLSGYSVLGYVFATIGALIIILSLLQYSAKTKHRSWAKLVRNILAAIIAICILCVIIVEIPIIRNAKTEPSSYDAKYVVILGAKVNGTVPSLSLGNRIAAANKFMKQNKSCIAIASGGKGIDESISEAACIKDNLVRLGISEDRIIIEDQSENTVQNISNSVAIIRSLENGELPSPIAVVSSEYHLYRARIISEKQGVDIAGVAAKTTLPFLKINCFLREFFALIKLRFFT